MKEVDIISKIVGRDTSGKAATFIPGAGAPSVNLDDYLLKKIWDSVFEVRTDSEGNPYLFEKLPLATQYGITMYADGGELDLPSIYEGLPIDNQTLFWENGVLKAKGGTEGAITSITSTMIVDALGYIPANGSDVTALQNKVNDFLSGSDTDTIINKWKELESFLSGLSESDNLATILGNKANKATTLEGYGITDAYTKTKVDELLANYVTVATAQTITGEKNFTGGLKVNGSPIVYDTTNRYWKLEGDLLVTGGITMYASDSGFKPSTVMDAIAVDGTTISKANGYLEVIGGTGGGLTEVHWDDVIGRPTLLSSFTDDVVAGKYLPLNNEDDIYIINTKKGVVNFKAISEVEVGIRLYLQEQNQGGLWSDQNQGMYLYNNVSRTLIGVSTKPYYKDGKTNVEYEIWHAGNFSPKVLQPWYGSFVAEDLSGRPRSANVYWTDKGLRTYLATSNMTEGKPPSDGYIIHAAWDNTGWNFQLCLGNKIYYRRQDSQNFVDWKEVAQVDSNVASASKLQTARTIWGQSFDGTGNVSGALSGATTGAFSSDVTINGSLTLAANKYEGDYALNMQNSDIIGVNTIFMNDTAQNGREGLQFARSDGKYDSIWALDGVLYFSPNGNNPQHTGSYSVNNVVLHSSNYSSYALPLSGGTMKGSILFNSTRKHDVGSFSSTASYIYSNVVSSGDNGNLYLLTGSSQIVFGKEITEKNYTVFGAWTSSGLGIGTREPSDRISIVSSSGEAFLSCKRSDTGHTIRFGIGSGGVNRGIWDNTLNKWLMYADSTKVNLTDNIWINQPNWEGGLSLNRTAANSGCGIAIYSNQTKLGIIGINGSQTLQFSVFKNNVDNLRFSVDKNGNGVFYGDSLRLQPDGAYYGSYLYFGDGSYCYIAERTDDAMTIYASKGVTINTDLLVSGGITMYSDIRKKTKLADVELTLKQIAEAPLIKHYYNNDVTRTVHVGSIAQYWAKMNDWFCSEDSDGYYTMEVQNAALASAISIARELVKYESETDKKIRLLEREVKRLKEEIRILKTV